MNTDDQSYLIALESARTWNVRTMNERKMRQPYLDNTTGLAQTNCHLWMSAKDRGPGLMPGQIYSYPARRWKRKRQEDIPPEELDTDLDAKGAAIAAEMMGDKGMDPVVSLNKPGLDGSRDKWYANTSAVGVYDEGVDELDEFEDLDDGMPEGVDDSDFEDGSSRGKRKKKSVTAGRGRKSARYADDANDKPFPCEICSSRYKTKQGLIYHMNHTHGVGEEEPVAHVPELPAPVDHASPEVPETKMPNDYCDFCLGDASENKKTKQREDMVSCADCGRSGHPTCLQFTDNMKISVLKYPWQCIECKSCGICGTSENDDQLLFCDDCDRGYHMYCLKPPLTQPPEGNWSCHLCIEEFHNGVKPEWMN